MKKYDAHVNCELHHNCHYEKFALKKQMFDSHPARFFNAITPYGVELDYPICSFHKKLEEEKGWAWLDAGD
jgi:hypothetical protein